MDIAFQDTNLDIRELTKSFDALQKIGYQAKTFGVIPFTDTLSIDYDLLVPTIMMGGTKMVKLWIQNKLPTNSVVFYDAEKFDQCYYSTILGDYLLNSTAEYTTWGAIRDTQLTKPLFTKPSSDLKYFAGTVLYPEYDMTVESLLRSQKFVDVDLLDNPDISILINYNIFTKIVREYRIFVVNNQIIDISQYMADGKVKWSEFSERDEIVQFVEKIMGLYSPHDNYVVDVCLHDGQYKIVEYNCLNCSGMYEIDREKLFLELLKL